MSLQARLDRPATSTRALPSKRSVVHGALFWIEPRHEVGGNRQMVATAAVHRLRGVARAVSVRRDGRHS